MIDAAPTDRTRVRRHTERAHYEREAIDAILDEAYVCHVSFAVDGQPFVIPTMFARDGDRLIVHGSTGTRMTRVLATGAPVSVAVTLLDGLVFARSATNHSMNYRSVVVVGTATPITDREEKTAAMRALIEKVAPGRWDVVRPPSDKELRETAILSIPLEESSAKIRTGPPVDEPEDVSLPVWGGVVPLALLQGGAPRPDEHVTETQPFGRDLEGVVRRLAPPR